MYPLLIVSANDYCVQKKNFYAFCDIINGIEIKLCCKLLNVLKTNTNAIATAVLSALLSMSDYIEFCMVVNIIN